MVSQIITPHKQADVAGINLVHITPSFFPCPSDGIPCSAVPQFCVTDSTGGGSNQQGDRRRINQARVGRGSVSKSEEQSSSLASTCLLAWTYLLHARRRILVLDQNLIPNSSQNFNQIDSWILVLQYLDSCFCNWSTTAHRFGPQFPGL